MSVSKNNEIMDNQQFSLFDDDQGEEILPVTKGNLNVVKLEFVEGHSATWRELFEGYDELYAITYSSGIGFINKLIGLFAKAEIIFGCEQVMSYSLNEVMAFQTALVERIRSNKAKDKLIDRIKDGTLKFLVTRTKLSHEKIYLLSAENGRRRVVMGSANMSDQAFSGRQRENISYMDGEEVYNWYMSIYESLKTDCTDDITEKSILVSDSCDGIDELPVSHTVKVKKALTIVPDKEYNDEIEFALNVNNISANIKPIIPKPDKKGVILLSPSSVTMMKTRARESAKRVREKRMEFPQLVINTDSKTVFLNEKRVALNPARSDVENDVNLFIQYMEGYNIFHGDYEYMQRRYYEFANWFFCSPFMAVMRDTAKRYNQNILPYPIFGLVYGQSKAGKTSFLETLQKMMIGQKATMAAPEFTRKTIDGLRYEVKGVPIIVDDLTRNRFSQHAIETIKNDSFGVAERNVNYPAVVISANEDVKSVTQEIIRRTVICRVQAGLTNTEVMKSNIVRKVQKNIGTAFYREYVKRMLNMIPDLIDEMKDDDAVSAPDILKVSSEIIMGIISEHTKNIPEYIRELSLDDYFSERVTGDYAIRTIQNAWKTSKECFDIDRKTGKLRYNAGQLYDADRIIKELPENLVATRSREWVVMDLETAKQFFSIDFKLGFFDKFLKK